MFSVPVTLAPFRTKLAPDVRAAQDDLLELGTLAHEQRTIDVDRLHVQRAGDLGAAQVQRAAYSCGGQDHVSELGALADPEITGDVDRIHAPACRLPWHDQAPDCHRSARLAD